MTPPGLAFASVSERAWAKVERGDAAPVLLGLGAGPRRQEKGSTPFTPATSTVVALNAALELILAEGLENVFARHVALGRACRAGAKAMGLELYSPDDDSAAVLTGILTPAGDRRRRAAARAARPLRDHDRRRPRRRRRPAVPDRSHRLRRHLRHHDRARRDRAPARRDGRDGRAGRGRCRGPRRLRDGRLTMRVLVRESIADAGVELLRSKFEVDDDQATPLEEIIDRYDAIVIRSATKLTADLIERATNLKMIGRAGVGVDNVDVEAATRRGIVVANAPESTVVSAAEQTVGLMVALARNIPQAHAALKQGRWERSKWGGVELAGQDARRARLRPDRPAGRPPRDRPRDARRRLRPVRRRRALPRARRRARGDRGRRPRRRRLPHAALAAHRRDARDDQPRDDREDEGRRPDRQRRPRCADRRGGARRGARRPASSPAPRSTSSRRSRTTARCSGSTTSS